MRKMRNEYKISARKSERKRPFGRPRRRWEVDVKWILEK
jgi:hypothetical protein